MVDYNINESAYRTRRYKGFVQFGDPSTPANFYRLKEKQSLSVALVYAMTAHYNDAGLKFLDPSGHSHQFSTTIKLTTDMIDNNTGDWITGTTTASSAVSTNQKTLSYWIEKLQRYEPILMTFVTTSEALSGPSGATGESTIKLRFSCQPTNFSFGMDATAQDVAITGQITDIKTISRS